MLVRKYSRRKNIEYVERKYLYAVYCHQYAEEPRLFAAYVDEKMAKEKKRVLESYGFKCEIRLLRVGK